MTDQETDSRDHHLLLGKWKNRNSEKLTGAENGSSEEELSQALKQWLYSSSTHDQKDISSQAERVSAHSFGTRLNAAMNLTGISNIRLSRFVYAGSLGSGCFWLKNSTI